MAIVPVNIGQAAEKFLETVKWVGGPKMVRALASANADGVRELAEAQADAARTLAQGHADAARTLAQGQVDAKKLIELGAVESRYEHREPMLLDEPKPAEAIVSAAGTERVETEMADDAEPIPLVRAKQLLDRAAERSTLQAVRQQENLEAVLQIANEHIRDVKDEDVSGDPVDDTWKARFFSAAQDISDDEMRRLWGAVLAGEIKHPKSFSLRCLDVLRNLTNDEARLFQRLAHFVDREGTAIFPSKEAKGAFGLKDLASLVDAGLIHPHVGLGTVMNYKSHDGGPLRAIHAFAEWAVTIEADVPSVAAGLPTILLTTAGTQLAALTERTIDPEHLVALRTKVRSIPLRAEIRRLVSFGADSVQASEETYDLDDSGRLVPNVPTDVGDSAEPESAGVGTPPEKRPEMSSAPDP